VFLWFVTHARNCSSESYCGILAAVNALRCGTCDLHDDEICISKQEGISHE
jgi:hypothetical protein